MATSEEKELRINRHLEAVDTALEDGPGDGEASEKFLRNLAEEARKLVGAIEALTPGDVDEIWLEDDGEDEDDEESEIVV